MPIARLGVRWTRCESEKTKPRAFMRPTIRAGICACLFFFSFDMAHSAPRHGATFRPATHAAGRPVSRYCAHLWPVTGHSHSPPRPRPALPGTQARSIFPLQPLDSLHSLIIPFRGRGRSSHTPLRFCSHFLSLFFCSHLPQFVSFLFQSGMAHSVFLPPYLSLFIHTEEKGKRKGRRPVWLTERSKEPYRTGMAQKPPCAVRRD